MRTIHNAFNVSFLFRDGAIVMEEDDCHFPTVRPTSDADKNGSFAAGNQQMVANLTTKLCDVNWLFSLAIGQWYTNQLFPFDFYRK